MKRKDYITEGLGHFELKSGKVMVSDPCYSRDTWCQHLLENVRPGIYNAFVKKSDEKDWGVRCAELIAVHQDQPVDPLTVSIPWKLVREADIGVDSGQAGIFEDLHYKDDSVIAEEPDFGGSDEAGEKWYGANCDVTLSKKQAGVIPFGVVSSSGFGDGSYKLYVYRLKNEIVAIRIVFI